MMGGKRAYVPCFCFYKSKPVCPLKRSGKCAKTAAQLEQVERTIDMFVAEAGRSLFWR